MDERWLSEATDRWVDAGVIDEQSAEAIRKFERQRGGGTRNRVTTVVAAMGAALIGSGLLILIGANWQELGTWIRTVILVIVPVGFAVSGILLDRRKIPRAGRGMWILAIISLGPGLVLLGDIYAPSIEIGTVFLTWGILALPMGHAFRTRLGTGIGLVTLLGGLAMSSEGHTGFLLVGWMATLVLAAGIPLRSRVPELLETYRLIGIAALIAVFLWINSLEGNLGQVDVPLWPEIVITAGLAFGAILFAERFRRRGKVADTEILLITVPFVGMILLLASIFMAQYLPEIVSFFIVQGILLAILLWVVSIAVDISSSPLVNLVVIGFFFQILSFLITITDELSGAIALVVIGSVILIAAIGLERGRRQLIDRIGGR